MYPCPMVTCPHGTTDPVAWIAGLGQPCWRTGLPGQKGNTAGLFPVTWQGFGERVSKERFARFQPLPTLQKSKLLVEATVPLSLTCYAFEKGHLPNSKPFLL